MNRLISVFYLFISSYIRLIEIFYFTVYIILILTIFISQKNRYLFLIRLDIRNKLCLDIQNNNHNACI